MRLNTLILPAMATCGMAQKFTFGSDCTQDQQTKITQGIADAVGYAKTALKVLDENKNDKKVQDMCKAVFDGHGKYNDNMEAFGLILKLISYFETTPTAGGPDSAEWKKIKKNSYLEVYCSSAAQVEKQSDGTFWNKPLERDMAEEVYNAFVNCHDPKYTPPKGQATTLMFVASSDGFDQKKYDRDTQDHLLLGLEPPPRKDYVKEFKNEPNLLNVCLPAYKQLDSPFGKELTKKNMQNLQIPAFVEAALKGKKDTKPVDLLRTFGMSMLHELTHTNQGGRTRDISKKERGDIPDCYRWGCVTKLKTWENADSVAMLALALNLYPFGFAVDNDGNIINK